MNSHTKLWLGLSLLLGAGVRLYFLFASQWLVEGDEAAVGLQALHILQGERPIFFPGQTYLGNFESYLVASVFALFGASAYTLKLVPLICSLLFIYLTFRLSQAVFASERAGLIAAWLAALAPAYFILWSVKARGGYVEALVCAQLAWLWAWHWLAETQKPVPPKQTGFYLGLIVGYALWLNPITLYILAPLACVMLRQIIVSWRAWRRMLPALITLIVGIGLGQLPLWLYRLAYGDTFATLINDVPPSNAWWDLAQQSWRYVWYDGLPTLIGLRAPKGAWLADWRIVIIPIYVLAFAWLIAPLAYRLSQIAYRISHIAIRHLPLATRHSPLATRHLPLATCHSLTLLLITLFSFPIFLIGALTSGNFAAIIPDSGLLTRFLLPLYIPTLLLLGAWLASLSRVWRIIVLGILLAVHGWSLISIDAIAFARNEFANQPLPASYADVIEFLQRENLRDVYTNHWLGYPLMFESREAIFAFDHTEAPFGMERFPRYGQRVKASPRPALVVFNPHLEPNPIDAKLHALNLAFRKQTLTHVIVYYDFAPRFEPKMLDDVLRWPYWD